jgi:hypothetical protein
MIHYSNSFAEKINSFFLLICLFCFMFGFGTCVVINHFKNNEIQISNLDNLNDIQNKNNEIISLSYTYGYDQSFQHQSNIKFNQKVYVTDSIQFQKFIKTYK